MIATYLQNFSTNAGICSWWPSAGRKVCGYMVTCIRGERAELVSVAVDPAERGRGAASALLESTLRRLRRRGAARLGLMVRQTNAPARAFYEKFDFRRVRIVRKYYEDGEDGLLMTKDLSPP